MACNRPVKGPDNDHVDIGALKQASRRNGTPGRNRARGPHGARKPAAGTREPDGTYASRSQTFVAVPW